jgi:hypothetical protein
MRPTIDAPVRGLAYIRSQRAVASLAVPIGLAGLVGIAATVPWATDGNVPWMLITVAVALLGSYCFMMTATTTIEAEGIVQAFPPTRRIRWEEVAYAHVGGLPFARRLRVRTASGRRVALAGASPELAAFERVAAVYAGR